MLQAVLWTLHRGKSGYFHLQNVSSISRRLEMPTAIQEGQLKPFFKSIVSPCIVKTKTKHNPKLKFPTQCY